MKMLDYAEEALEAAMGDAAWEGLELSRGEVVEVYMPGSDWEQPAADWAGFLVMQVSLEVGTQAVVFEAKSLGCGDGELTKELANTFNRRRGQIHLCSSSPCATTNTYELHATKIRVFRLQDFSAPYVTRSMKAQIRKWLRIEDEKRRSHLDRKSGSQGWG